MTKTCSKCKQVKSISLFSRDSHRADGLRPSCKECGNLRNKIFYEQNKCEIRQRQKNYYIENPNLEEIKEKKYRIKNKREIHRRMSERTRRDPILRLRKNISRAINHALKTRNSSKHGQSSFDILGYTQENLITHLESQFESWMNWDNHGGRANNPKQTWHIDHIRPVSSFDIKGPDCEEFKKCWALSNLRPLEKIANIKKGNKLCTLESSVRKASSVEPVSSGLSLSDTPLASTTLPSERA